jgi:acetyl esterase/lipase
VGVSVEAGLAPETPYPGPLEDCYEGLRWTYDHADELGVDRARIGIGGVSAGGGLAAGLALLARDRGEVPVAFQLLECPMIDDRQTTSSSRLDGLPIWSRESNEFGWRSYLGDLYGTDDIPPYAAAARAENLVGLPPALVIVGGADGFRDEDIEYALRLNQSGVPTELHVLPGAPHGVQMFMDSAVARRWGQIVTEWLGLQLDR